jgi:hypothetical protein
MKKHLFTVIAILASLVLSSQSIPNGGFEAWNTTSYENPLNYQTSNLGNDNGVQSPVNAVKTTDAYHGNYAIKLTTTLSTNGADTSFAYFANGDPGKTPPGGGFAFNQLATGIRFHYKSNIMPNDSSLIIVMFKKAGVSIGNYIYAISATHTTYTLFSKTFSPALPMAPDSVVIGMASSYPFGSNPQPIPGNMLQVDSISFTGVSSQPADLNGDLELWQTISNSQIFGWDINGQNQGGNYRTTDAYSGTYALELQTQTPSFGGGGVSAAFATSGRFTNNGPPRFGYPYNKQIDTLVFFYKYLPADPNDSAHIDLVFSVNGVNNYGLQKYMHVSGGYQMVQIPFNVPTAPDTLLINLASSTYSTYPIPASYIGSDLKIDNMYLKSQKIPVANFNMQASGCVGQPIQLTDNSANMVSGWNWIIPGGSPSSAVIQNPQVTYATPGTKTITLYATNFIGSTNTSAAYSRTIAVYPIPSVSANSAVICGGNNATLTATGATSYSWNSGQTTSSISVTPTITTNYTVTGTSNGCSNTAVSSVVIPATSAPNICMVTTDSTSTNNIIIWEKPISNKVDSFIIYREVTSGTYARIGGQKFGTLSQFTDTVRSVGPANGNPNIGTYRYKIQIKDSCGNLSPLSPYHNSTYFSGNTGTFTWNIYTVEGQTLTPVTQFNLLRDDFNTGFWHVVGSVAGTQGLLNDPNYSSYMATGNWRVEALGFNCNPTARTTQVFNKSKSNVKNNFSVGINDHTLNVNFVIAPNPVRSELQISFSNPLNLKTGCVITDVLGKIISKTELAEGHSITVPVTELTTGIYFVKIEQGNNTAVKKFIKE